MEVTYFWVIYTIFIRRRITNIKRSGVFGFDTTSEQGRSNTIIPLAAVWDWYKAGTGFMSTDDKEDPLEGIRDLPLVF